MPDVAASEKQKLSAMEVELAAARAELAATVMRLQRTEEKLERVSGERDVLRKAYLQAKEQLDLLRRRIYLAKAERIDSSQLELEFAQTHRRLEVLATALEEAAAETTTAPGDADVGHRPAAKPPGHRGKKSSGRRDLRDLDLPETRVEILDPALEGKAERIGWEESCQGGYQRSGPLRVVIARATYKTSATEEAPATLVTAPLPRALLSRSLLAPSLLAHIIAMKFRFGMPYFRQERMLESEGLPLDRGTMARVVEDAGASLGAIVEACAQDARRTACCLATDATGVAIQPERLTDGSRQPCKKGHFFVVLADKKHVFFEYQPKHTSAVVCEMFRSFSGFIQADAHAIYDALFRGQAVDDPELAPLEVGCWSHTRRRFWEAAIAGYPIGRE
ncbi:MAG TPA: transposase, partial [Polyangiaceae bacterium]|nr:transposase [Polyangiaceae bacterium]